MSGPIDRDVDLDGDGDIDADDAGGLDGDVDTHTATSLWLDADNDKNIYVLFDSRGAFSEMYFGNGDGFTVRLAGESLALFLSEYDPDDIVADVQRQAFSLLSKPESLWLNVGRNGGMSIGYNVPPEDGFVQDMILESRTLANERPSARQ